MNKYKKQRQEYHKKYPWKRIFRGIKARCNNPKEKAYKDYGLRGIKCLITEEEIKSLWFRGKAYLMKNPTIDRKDNNGHYVYSNCRFIEKGLNTTERNVRVLSIPILQYDLQGNFLREFKSIRDADRFTGINQSSITKCAKNNPKYSHAGCYKWKYKNE